MAAGGNNQRLTSPSCNPLLVVLRRERCVSGLEMPQMPNILFYQTFYKICCLQHICGNIFVASALKAPSKMLGTSGAKNCSSPTQGPLAPPSRHVPSEHFHVSYFCLEPRNLEPAPHHSFIMSAFIVPVSVSPNFSRQNLLY